MAVYVCVGVRAYIKKENSNYLDVYIFGRLHVTFLWIQLWVVITKLQEPIKFNETHFVSAWISSFLNRSFHSLCKCLVIYMYVWFRLNTIIRTYNNYCYHFMGFLLFHSFFRSLLNCKSFNLGFFFFGGCKHRANKSSNALLKSNSVNKTLLWLLRICVMHCELLRINNCDDEILQLFNGIFAFAFGLAWLVHLFLLSTFIFHLLILW